MRKSVAVNDEVHAAGVPVDRARRATRGDGRAASDGDD
jgi:hypothetical protein